jgi:hypothetical protein
MFSDSQLLQFGLRHVGHPAVGRTRAGGLGMASIEDRQDRETRAVANQSLFREINERVKELNCGFSMVLPLGEWICECANDTCVERIQMSPEEYGAVRGDGARFFVAPSQEHVLAASQRIIERRDSYWVVEKIGEPRELAKRADPRTDNGGPLPLHT